MNPTKTIRTAFATVAVTAGALLLGGLNFGTAEAQNNLKQLSLAMHNYESTGEVGAGDVLIERWQSSGVATGDGDTDGRDFLVWQRQAASGEEFDCSELVQWASGSGVTIHAYKDQDVEVEAAIAGSDLADWQSNYGAGSSAARDGAGNHEVGHWMGLYN